MLTTSPIAPRATSASPRTFHYAPSARSPHQSPKVVGPLSRRHSRHILPPASPSPPTPKQYVAVDAATQYSPMEPFDPTVPLRSADAPAPRLSSTTANLPQSRPDSAAPEPPPEPNLAPIKPSDPQANPLSPNKRRSSHDHDQPEPHSSVVAASQPSSSKRAKPEQSPPKELPLKYELCEVEDLVVLISNMLGELIKTNDSIAMKSGSLTRFHSRTAPGISVQDYLQRLAKHATLTPPLLLSMVYYIDRLCALYPDFTINTLTVHRFLITAATVAGKGLSDSFWNNSFYARVGGVKIAELKLLELEFLYRVDWRIVPNPEVLVAYYKGLVERCAGYTLEEEPKASSMDDEAEDDESDEMDDGEAIRAKSRKTSSTEMSIGFTAISLNLLRPDTTTDKAMKLSIILSGLAALTLSSATATSDRTAAIYVQPVSQSPLAPALLAEIQYDPENAPAAEITSYEAPEISEDTKLLRVGVYSPSSKQWVSSSTIASVENLSKGYSPTIILSVDRKGAVLSAALKGVAIDAGQTRDFGPQAKVLVTESGKQPDLNKPVVLSPEGKKVVPEEKTLFQKYWWVIGIVVLLTMTGGGGGDGK
ncbi:cyclin-domain-containing protein [Xylariomycetidae sp. FL2044]|nr:cyclin-domain-containing protein [Xylariomycetidae sp. FL2044]